MDPQSLMNMLGQGIQKGVSGVEGLLGGWMPTSKINVGWTPDTPNTQAAASSPQQPVAPPTSVTPTAVSTPQPTPAVGRGRNPDFSQKPLTPPVKSAIENAAKEFNVPVDLMYDVGWGEGGYRADAKNDSPEGQKVGTPVGLYQFTPGTWNGDLANYAKTTKTSFKDFNPQTPREDPVANARAAAFLISHGQLQRWEASRPNWGRFYSKEELSPYYSQSGGFGNE